METEHDDQCPKRGNLSCFPKNINNFNSTCCTEHEPCGPGEGQCKHDYHCLIGLRCGKNNCIRMVDGKNVFPKNTNCCEFPSSRT